MEETTRVLRFFGLSLAATEERLGDVLTDAAVTADLTARDEDVTLRLTASDEAALDTVTEQVAARMNVYLYSRDGKDLAARVVELLRQHGMTVALAESCTGGLTAAALTAVPGCSGVFGTGVVSYSCACKEKLLHVKKETLKAHGAVSGETAGEMARGVRAVSGARLGVSITGEAGPQPAEEHPVGTVYIALADGKRTWVHKHNLGDGRDRTAIRQAAADCALDLVRRYLEAYPAVMAGGALIEAPAPRKPGDRIRLPNLFPRREDSLKKRLLKIAVWVLALLLVAGTVLGGYHLALAPDNNRQLQDSLRGLYWDESASLSNIADGAGAYPEGMMPRFRSLYDINPDIGGWICIPDTVIDYPVMTYRDGYYNNHSFADEYSFYGQPYFSADTLPQTAQQPETLLVYGNNTGDEQMFSALLSYRRIAFLRENAVIELNTLYRAATWQIFAVLAVDEGEDTDFAYTDTAFADAAAREEYIRQLRDRSLFDCSLQVTAADRLLLLSTNAQREYGQDGARLVIAAVEITGVPDTVTYTANWNAIMPANWTETSARTTQATERQDMPEQDAAGHADAQQTTATTVTPPTAVTTTATTTAATTTTTEATTTTTTTTTAPEPTTTTTTLPVDDDAGEGDVTDEETETEKDADLGN